jgi:hypothetical protein
MPSPHHFQSCSAEWFLSGGVRRTPGRSLWLRQELPSATWAEHLPASTWSPAVFLGFWQHAVWKSEQDRFCTASMALSRAATSRRCRQALRTWGGWCRRLNALARLGTAREKSHLSTGAPDLIRVSKRIRNRKKRIRHGSSGIPVETGLHSQNTPLD